MYREIKRTHHRRSDNIPSSSPKAYTHINVSTKITNELIIKASMNTGGHHAVEKCIEIALCKWSHCVLLLKFT